MRAREIRIDGKLYGWIARAGSVNGWWNEYTQDGFKIQRYQGTGPMMALGARFEPEIYKTRSAAIRALTGGLK